MGWAPPMRTLGRCWRAGLRCGGRGQELCSCNGHGRLAFPDSPATSSSTHQSLHYGMKSMGMREVGWSPWIPSL
ncbi:hypothetical protein AALO_G00284380 [Alosa alosa]|uniref:Arginine vasotocin receptor n=1 Tax=Alosa alosa TaxID=278164 RepID=A0AAV6FL22_9TELE|nr:hypothetical protein AALO_G00284380 [Alosa alosa]